MVSAGLAFLGDPTHTTNRRIGTHADTKRTSVFLSFDEVRFCKVNKDAVGYVLNYILRAMESLELSAYDMQRRPHLPPPNDEGVAVVAWADLINDLKCPICLSLLDEPMVTIEVVVCELPF